MTNSHPPGTAPGFLPQALVDVDGTERMSADDMATRREAEFLQAALAAQQRAHAAPVAPPGVCRYCKARCMPAAVYCDEDCRADHEAEQAIRRRQGLA